MVIEGWPQPVGATMAERRDALLAHHDHLRRAVVCEPRGHSAIVGALLTPPVSPDAAAGVVFFNNGTYLGMCGHGLIGVVRTLEFLGRIAPGVAVFDTPVGRVTVDLASTGAVTIENVPARVQSLDVRVDVPGYGVVTGDVVWGGNWFFITHSAHVPVAMDRVDALMTFTRAIQDAINAQGITGEAGAEIDHIEISAPPLRGDADSRNFVLCSGGEYDRSPCGTGTSATMAARHARGELALGARWRQEGIAGGLFTGWLTSTESGVLIPHVQGRASITGEATLHLDENDPFRFGIPTDHEFPVYAGMTRP